MIAFELTVLTIIGLGVVVTVPAALYVLLPQSVLESSARHGRFAGLGTQVGSSYLPRGQVRLQARLQARPQAPTRTLDSLLAQEA